MSKLLKDIPVHLNCPACGKVQRAKLKWAKNHKSLKCRDCGKNIDLKGKEAKAMIAKTARVTQAFADVLDALHAEAKRAGKAVKAKKDKKSKKQAGKKRSKPAGRKTTKRRAPAKPTSMMPANLLPNQPSP